MSAMMDYLSVCSVSVKGALLVEDVADQRLSPSDRLRI